MAGLGLGVVSQKAAAKKNQVSPASLEITEMLNMEAEAMASPEKTAMLKMEVAALASLEKLEIRTPLERVPEKVTPAIVGLHLVTLSRQVVPSHLRRSTLEVVP